MSFTHKKIYDKLLVYRELNLASMLETEEIYKENIYGMAPQIEIQSLKFKEALGVAKKIKH